MTTIINTPGNNEEADSPIAMIIGIVILLAVVGLFFVYVLPTMRNDEAKQNSLDINVNIPTNDETSSE